MSPATANHAATGPGGLERRELIVCGIWLVFAGCGLVSRAEASLAPPVDSVGAALAAIAGKAAASDKAVASDNAVASNQVQIKLPQLIEDGAVVPVTVSTQLTGVRELYVLADMNPMPIAAQFRLGAGVAPRMALRVKLAGSGRVYAAVRTDAGLFWTAADAVVSVGGCS
jgi:sulfur-oxidizing protein SoxY